tara:strand:+ start:1190 stop:1684 length:495 start_codon:yes stop_codon:yes gene_type:complete
MTAVQDPRADIERYVDWDGVTVVVDPIRRDHWIYDGYSKHTQSQNRGMAEHIAAIQRSENWQRDDQVVTALFTPTLNQLDRMHKFASRDCGNEAAVRHGLKKLKCKYTPESARDGGGDGHLPVIERLKYFGTLQNKSTGTIEHEIREADRYMGTRLYDTNGYTR